MYFCCSNTGYIQASRALMIASIVFGSFGIVAALSGMQCSKIGGENYVLKGRIAAVGGVFFFLQGKDQGVGLVRQNKTKQRKSSVCSERFLEYFKTLSALKDR